MKTLKQVVLEILPRLEDEIVNSPSYGTDLSAETQARLRGYLGQLRLACDMTPDVQDLKGKLLRIGPCLSETSGIAFSGDELARAAELLKREEDIPDCPMYPLEGGPEDGTWVPVKPGMKDGDYVVRGGLTYVKKGGVLRTVSRCEE